MRAGPPLSRRQEAQARSAEQQRVQAAVKNIKGPIEITEEDREATVKAAPSGPTHLVNLSPDFEDEEVADAALQAKAKRDSEEAAKKVRPELAEGGVVTKSTKCHTTSAVYAEPKPKMQPRARPKFLAKWFVEAFGRKGVADAALAAAATASVPFAFATIPEGDEDEGAAGTPSPPSSGVAAQASHSAAGIVKVTREVICVLELCRASGARGARRCRSVSNG